MSATTAKWTLFFTMAAVVPVFFMMFVTAGFLPLFAIVLMSFSALVETHVVGAGFMFFIGMIHSLVYGAILYMIALEISYRLRKYPPFQVKEKVLKIVGCLLVLSILPIYGGGHGSFHWKNVFLVYLSEVLQIFSHN